MTRVVSKVTVATSVARLTWAVATPSRRVRAFSTRPTQDAQVIPPMSRVQLSSVCGEVAVGAVVVVMVGS